MTAQQKQKQLEHRRQGRTMATSASSRLLLGAAVIGLSALTAVEAGTPVTFRNDCPHDIALWDNQKLESIKPGGTFFRELPPNFHGMFRHSKEAQATLAEFSTDGGKLWYDISIIPTGPKGGPGYCEDLDKCRKVTGGKGFNVPMEIAAEGCKTRTCLADGCADAYQFPKDDGKTTACRIDARTTVTFCPGGQPTPGPTPPPPPPPPPPPTPTSTPPPPPAPTTTQPAPIPVTTAPVVTPPTNTPEPTTTQPQVTVGPIQDNTDDSKQRLPGGGLRGSGSADEDVAKEADGGPMTIATKAPQPTVGEPATATGGNSNPYTKEPAEGKDGKGTAASKEATTKSGAGGSGSSLATALSVAGGFLAMVAGAFIFVAYRKRKQLEELEPKDDSMRVTHHSLVTPHQQIHML